MSTRSLSPSLKTKKKTISLKKKRVVSTKLLKPKKTLKATSLKPDTVVIRDAVVLPKVHTHDKVEPLSHAQAPHKKSGPLGHLLVEKLLTEGGFHGGVSSNKDVLDRYSNDESIFTIRPQVVLQPKTARDVEIAVSVLGKETLRFPSLSLTPRAAGTGLGGGSLTDSIMIDVCTHLHTIDEPKVTRDGITITCDPGSMWRDVEKKT